MIHIHILDRNVKLKGFFSDDRNIITLHKNKSIALTAVEMAKPTIIVLNHAILKNETVDYIRLLLQLSSESKIVLIGDKLPEKTIINCLLAGAKGYQDRADLEFYAAKLISVIAAGEAWITRRMISSILNTVRRP